MSGYNPVTDIIGGISSFLGGQNSTQQPTSAWGGNRAPWGSVDPDKFKESYSQGWMISPDSILKDESPEGKKISSMFAQAYAMYPLMEAMGNSNQQRAKELLWDQNRMQQAAAEFMIPHKKDMLGMQIMGEMGVAALSRPSSIVGVNRLPSINVATGPASLA